MYVVCQGLLEMQGRNMMRFFRFGCAVVALTELFFALSSNVCLAQWVSQGLYYNPDPKVSQIVASAPGFAAVI